MNVKLFGAVAILALLGTVASALAVIVRVRYSGTVTDGVDGAGIFGLAGADLAGKSFTASFLFDTSKGTSTFSPTLNQVVGGTDEGVSTPALGTTLEIEGITSATYDGDVDAEMLGSNGNICCDNQQSHETTDENNNMFLFRMEELGNSGDIPATIDVPFSFTIS